ncbi:MAG: hypothetical protein ACFFD4_28135 [Candidatus Odinarchaeota archaeon]
MVANLCKYLPALQALEKSSELTESLTELDKALTAMLSKEGEKL